MNRERKSNVCLGVGIVCASLGLLSPCLGMGIGIFIQEARGLVSDGGGFLGGFIGLPLGILMFLLGLGLIKVARDMEKYPPYGKCKECGYSLTDITKATCPECGHVIEKSAAESG